MAPQEGLTRRRGAANAASTTNGEEAPGSAVTSPTPRSNPYDTRAPETSYSAGENGHKIAFDPRDISENEERSKQPKLTLMEEVILLGLKDKQVGQQNMSLSIFEADTRDSGTGISLILERQHILRFTRMHSHRTGI